ncbi:cadherin-23-like [Amphibalanus amphitrite]|uniref:cadherin-23-like n=1 Tax=Amphibalanus amphitrite TaxID=1232801 RepID=UPI001C92901A|nr:cadherin-23-like [Amphibalanus amphitrite]
MLRFAVTLLWCACTLGQNTPPQFEKGGDMLDFAIREDAEVGSQVYQVVASDADGDRVSYSISGDFFSIDRINGRVTLVKPIDRERMRSVEVILTITDTGTDGEEPNLVSVRRLVPIVDANDNPPVFNGLDNGAYRFSVSETSEVGSTVFSKVNVTDADFGMNGEVNLVCDSNKTPEACERFDVRGVGLRSGVFIGIVTLREPVDFEAEKHFDLSVRATDNGKPQLTATARMVISVEDVQDQPPEFVNGPYSATVAENTPPGTLVLDILARDGDTGIPRELKLAIIGDNLGYFRLEDPVRGPNGAYSTKLITGNTTLDRENPDILRNVGLYQFHLEAEEVVPEGGVGEKVVTNVTVVVTDEDDQLPVFNKNQFLVFIPEDTANGTPLPGLEMLVSDSDEGAGSQFDLRLRDVQASEGVFDIFPTSAAGRTPVLIKVTDSSRLNYEQETERQFVFAVVASQGKAEVSATVTVLVTDANDNAPEFDRDSFSFSVPEDAAAGHVLGDVTARDRDSGQLGAVHYRLRGFGAERFHVNKVTGQLSVGQCTFVPCLDYEDQKSYALTVVARDGGNRTSTASVFVDVTDVNDNRPQFAEREYRRTLEDGSDAFFPDFYVKATDADEDGQSAVTYAIIEGNLNATFAVDPTSGQVTVARAVRHSDTASGRFDLVIEATDSGQPPLSSNVRVFVVVGRDSNEAPIFRSSPYSASINETASAGQRVLRVSANDPDASDAELAYYLQEGAADTFQINGRGEISVREGAVLDLERGGQPEYDLIIHAVDRGQPRKTGTAQVTITVGDINDSPPRFEPNSYVEYVPENSQPGRSVVTVAAADLDQTAELRYQLVLPIMARDRAGVTVPANVTDFSRWLAVNARTGEVTVNTTLDHSLAAVLVCQIRVTDVNTEIGERSDTAELTVFIQAFSDNKPVFEAPWLPSDPVIGVSVPEEGQSGSTIYTLRAKDPVSGQAVTRYEEIAGSDVDDWFSVDESVGEVMINRRLDFDTMENKTLGLRVRAVSGQRSSQALVLVTVTDINDNQPLFGQKTYEVEVSEETYYPTVIATITARDIDSESGYGNVTFSLAGTTADQFHIEPVAGTLHVARGVRLDRESTPVHLLRVVTQDNPTGDEPPNKSYAQLTVTVTDENDNRPLFSEDGYTAVVAENALPGTAVITVTASDLDEGDSGHVRYSIVDAGTAEGLFDLEPETGALSVLGDLSGKGRTAPYRLSIRAQDQGDDPLLSDVTLEVYIGDVSNNDGIPRFVKPEPGEAVGVLENLPSGSLVLHARATDPDDPLTPSGHLQYSFLGGDTVSKDGLFSIDSRTGTLRTRASLDREETSEHHLLLQASDRGQPPQQAVRALTVTVRDVDDNEPRFERSKNAPPKELVVTEELEQGSVVTDITAVDGDDGKFGEIHYIITAGDPEGVFTVNRTETNVGQLLVASRLDREEMDHYLLTVRCVSETPQGMQRAAYDPEDMSMVQLRIQVLDIDDNPPLFTQENITTGVKVNAPVRTLVTALTAVDPDLRPAPVRYVIDDVTFSRHVRATDRDEMRSEVGAFVVDEASGQLWTNEGMAKYSGGFFEVHAAAMSADEPNHRSEMTIRVFVLQDTELMKLVFSRPPAEVKPQLASFRDAVQSAVPAPVSLHLYDTSYHGTSDGRIDFSSTAACFQIESAGDIYTAAEAKALLDETVNARLEALFKQYHVQGIEPCVQRPGGSGYQFAVVETLVLAIGVFIVVGTLIALIVLSVHWHRYKRDRRRRQRKLTIQEVTIPTPVVATPLPPGSRQPSVVGEGNYGFSPGSIDGAHYSTVPA